jgi:hypothetical protein
MKLPVLSALLAFAVGLFRSRASLCLAHLARRHPWAVDHQGPSGRASVGPIACAGSGCPVSAPVGTPLWCSSSQAR